MRWTQEKVSKLLEQTWRFNSKKLVFIKPRHAVDMQDEYGFVPVCRYGEAMPALNGEIGFIGNSRYIDNAFLRRGYKPETFVARRHLPYKGPSALLITRQTKPCRQTKH